MLTFFSEYGHIAVSTLQINCHRLLNGNKFFIQDYAITIALNIRVHKHNPKDMNTHLSVPFQVQIEIYSILVKKYVKQNGFMSYLGLYKHHSR